MGDFFSPGHFVEQSKILQFCKKTKCGFVRMDQWLGLRLRALIHIIIYLVICLMQNYSNIPRSTSTSTFTSKAATSVRRSYFK